MSAPDESPESQAPEPRTELRVEYENGETATFVLEDDVAETGRIAERMARRWLAIAVTVMLALGALGWGMAAYVSRDARPDNLAAIDAHANEQVRTEVSRILTQVLSYDYSDPGAMSAAAEQLLIGDARKEHEVLFKAMRDKAGDQKLMLTTQVQAAAVKELRGDSASLLVFLDQASQRAEDKEATVSAAQLAVKATRVDGVWKISRLQTL